MCIKKLFVMFCILMPLIALAQKKGQDSASLQALEEIKNFRQALNDQYKDPVNSPLPPAKIRKFKNHNFFAPDLNYRVTAKLVKLQDEPFFEMNTSSGKIKQYRKYAELHFQIDGRPYKLFVYQSASLLEKEDYKDYLFLPFTDLTTGKTTYGGGRYLDLRVPEGDTLVIDFNLAYNPYCAYSDRYSCPIVPAENFLDTEVNAGIRFTDKSK